MNQLVALCLEPGPAFVDALRRAWDDGDAVAPIDHRLPKLARAALAEHLSPSRCVTATGVESLAGGRPMATDDAVVVTTSGSTGSPKAAVLTHSGLAAAATASSSYLGVDPSSDRWLSCLPLAHVGGLGVVIRALLTDTPVEVHAGFDAAAVASAARAGATLTSLVPTTLARIAPGDFRRILVGGQAPPAHRPAHVIATYGLTETGGGVVYDGTPLEGVELRIDRAGVIEVRSPMVLRCYLGGFDPKDGEGWFSTGDLGEITDDGKLRVFGRQGDLIITGGENVWPGPVERILDEHPGIADVAVVGRAHGEWGQQVTALIVPRDARNPPPLAELRDLVKAALPAFAAPRAIELVEGLPRTTLGKLRRYDLPKPRPDSI